MRKFTLLILAVMAGMVTASAAKLYVNTTNVKNENQVSWWTNVRIYAYNSDTDNNGWNYSETGVVSSTTTLFGKQWYVFDLGSYSNAIVQCFKSDDHSITDQSTDITNITNDRFVLLANEKDNGKWKWYEDGYAFRSNVLNNWSAKTCNMTVVDNNTLSYTLTKTAVDESGVDKIWFRILNQEGQIYPKADGTTLSLGESTSDYYNNWDDTKWSFGIEKPSFDYEKIVVTASLSGTTWTIKADAFISKTVSGENEYATLGAPVALDLSNLGVVQAYTLTADAATGKITKTTKSDALAANEGVVLHNATGTDVTLSIPVAASATASANNDLKAFTGGSAKLAQVSETGYTNYILSKEADGVGFYKVNSAGNSMGANTAYLQVKDAAIGARTAFFFDNDATSINTIESVQQNGTVYNLNGQLVAQPTKGLYIVNGKKVIVK